MFCGSHMVAWKALMCQTHRKVGVLYSASASSSLSTLFVYRIGCCRHRCIPLLPHQSKAGGGEDVIPVKASGIHTSSAPASLGNVATDKAVCTSLLFL